MWRLARGSSTDSIRRVPTPTAPQSDAEFTARLRSETRFAQLVHLDSCASTQDVARELPRGAAIVWADCQTAGRGRQGRTWSGAPGQDVEMTLRVDGVRMQDPSVLAAALPTAVLLGLEAVAERRLDLKWPNDVLCDGRKLCGVLLDAHGGPELTCLLGVGVNVNRTRFPAELREIATSLALVTGHERPREAVVLAVARAVETALTDVARGETSRLEAAFRDRLGLVGKRVMLETPRGERVEGRLERLDFRRVILDGDRGFPIATLRLLRPTS
jgi:BirA family biotin operon repressor/biotin-[acetyl-CoA-carboxylase] ligase